MIKIQGDDFHMLGIEVGHSQGLTKAELINPPQIRAKVYGKDLNILLDTGANTSVVSEELFQELVRDFFHRIS